MITLLLLVRATYMYGVVLHAHPVRGESHNQRNTTGEVATHGCVRRFHFLKRLCFWAASLAGIASSNLMYLNIFFESITCEVKNFVL